MAVSKGGTGRLLSWGKIGTGIGLAEGVFAPLQSSPTLPGDVTAGSDTPLFLLLSFHSLAFQKAGETQGLVSLGTGRSHALRVHAVDTQSLLYSE